MIFSSRVQHYNSHICLLLLHILVFVSYYSEIHIPVSQNRDIYFLTQYITMIVL